MSDNATVNQGVEKRNMTVTKFLVKVNRAPARVSAYVLKIGDGPIQTTSSRKLALLMGKFAAEDAIESLRKRGSEPEMLPVRVPA
jgi:hypothetical protein